MKTGTWAVVPPVGLHIQARADILISVHCCHKNGSNAYVVGQLIQATANPKDSSYLNITYY